MLGDKNELTKNFFVIKLIYLISKPFNWYMTMTYPN